MGMDVLILDRWITGLMDYWIDGVAAPVIQQSNNPALRFLSLPFSTLAAKHDGCLHHAARHFHHQRLIAVGTMESNFFRAGFIRFGFGGDMKRLFAMVAGDTEHVVFEIFLIHGKFLSIIFTVRTLGASGR
jgi:hypothetical protein